MWKLVIIEDEDIIREGLISYVNWQELGYEVVGEAMNGREGLAVIREKKPDVILTDIKMPVMDGLQMLQILREEKNETTAVVLSGYEDFEYARKAISLGVFEYILKPLSIPNLQETMKKINREHREKMEHAKEYQRLKREETNNRQQLLINTIGLVLWQREFEISPTLQEELEGLYYSILILSKEGFSFLESSYDYLKLLEEDKVFEQEVFEALSHGEVVLNYRLSMGERILCQWDEDRELLKKRKKQTEEKLKLQFTGKDHIRICQGSIGYGLEGLKSIYQKVREKQKEEYIKELNDIFRVEKGNFSTFHYMTYDASCLFAEVKTGTYETIDRELSYFEQELERQKIVSHMHLLLIVSNLYGELMKLPGEVSSTPEEILDNPMEYYKRIVTDTEKESMIQNLRTVCRQFNDFFLNINQGKFDGILKRATDYMQKEYGNPALQIKDVAKVAFVSNSYLSIIIKQGTGKTFVEYLTELRMEQAEKLLRETELKSYEIAELCGFSNATYFSTVFKSAYGMSPSAYKKEHKN